MSTVMRTLRSGHVIIEEYMAGEEVSVEIVVYKGEVHILAVTDKSTLRKALFRGDRSC